MIKLKQISEMYAGWLHLLKKKKKKYMWKVREYFVFAEQSWELGNKTEFWNKVS